MRICQYLIFLIAFGLFSLPLVAEQKTLTVASTTSLENSGLYDNILPYFKKETGIQVNVIPVGTGRALSIARRGDADLVVVHDESSELRFMIEGGGIERKTFMYNHYILVGPKKDKAGIASMQNIVAGFNKIAQDKVPFISRGDQSGTHKKELALWQIIGLSMPIQRTWYKETGSGMGATLGIANELGAYTITDTATWLSFKRRDYLDVIIADGSLLNTYSVILTNPKKHPHVRYADAKLFSEWLTRGKGAELIEAFYFGRIKLFHLLVQDPLGSQSAK